MIANLERRGFLRHAAALFFIFFGAGISAGGEAGVLLTVESGDKTLAAFTAADLAAMPRTTASVDRDGETANYEGVLLYDVLLRAYGLPPGKNLPFNSKMTYIVGTARDGYQAMFAMGEIAPMFAGARVMIADKRNGGPLLARQQPLQMVAPQDKAQGRAMYSLVKLQVVELKSPGAIR